MKIVSRIIPILITTFFVLMLGCEGENNSTLQNQQNWTHYVRTAGHGLSLDRVEGIIKSVQETHVFGVFFLDGTYDGLPKSPGVRVPVKLFENGHLFRFGHQGNQDRNGAAEQQQDRKTVQRRKIEGKVREQPPRKGR